MKTDPPPETSPIDAVITWVNGSDPTHDRQRRHHMAQSGSALHENAVNPHRWADSDEISFCLRSIEANAPWIRTIWIVVANDGPDLRALSPAVREKIRIVRHADIFAGFPGALPTFNSLAIESVMWRIAGLSDRFLYFNDDVFLTAPLHPRDVFIGTAPVLRGAWRDFSRIEADVSRRSDPALFHHWMQINAGRILGVGSERLFSTAHVVHPMRVSVMAALFAQNRALFASNASHRFRDLAQFLPQGLHNHACLAQGNAVLRTDKDHLHLTSGIDLGRTSEQVRTKLDTLLHPGVKFLCVNDLPQLEAVMSDLRNWIAAAIQGGGQGAVATPPAGGVRGAGTPRTNRV